MRLWLLLSLLCACRRPTEQAHVVAPDPTPAPVAEAKAAPTGPLRAEHAVFLFGLYHLSPAKGALDLGRKLAHKAGYTVTDKIPAEPPMKPLAIVMAPPLSEAPPPNAEELQYRGRGLSAEQVKRLQNADSVTIISFVTVGPSLGGYHAALATVRELAQKSDAVVHDASTRATYTPEKLAILLDGWSGDIPDVRPHVTLDFYREGDLGRIVSLGMQKFGLPDVAVSGVSMSDSNSMASLVNVILQTLIERGQLDRPGELDLVVAKLRNARIKKDMIDNYKKGASGVAAVKLAIAKPEQGDAENRLLELIFPGPADSLQVRQTELLAKLFGSEDSLIAVPDNDPEILLAHRRALAALLKLKPKFSPRPPPLEHLMVKAPFATPSGKSEWMWIEVVRWEGKKIQGILENDPYEVKNLKAGARVEADEESIFDYLLVHKDGTKEGNQTAKLIEGRQK